MTKYLGSLLIISLFTGVGYSFSMEDIVPPYVVWDNNSYPDGANIWTDSIIGFGLADYGSSGVATTSIRATATIDKIDQPITIEPIDGLKYHITCKITMPNIPMYNKEMVIRIQASDNAGNEMKTFERRVLVSSRTLSLENIIAYPNPCQPSSGNIFFSPLPRDVEIQIFDVSGENIREVCLPALSEGIWEWNLRNNEGDGVAPGLYIYLIKDRERHTTTTGKILIIR
ncbi:MAG: T9SS type A sorting domain-containing protein [Candidatus Desantisbacteria bacterium]